MDYAYGKGQPPGRRYHWCLPGGIACVVMGFWTILIVSLIVYIDYNGHFARGSKDDQGMTREAPSPGYPGSPVPDEQLSMASESIPEELVVQEGHLHVRRDDYAHRYTTEEQVVERDPDVHEQAPPPPFKLPKLPIPSEILDIPIKIPTKVSDILGDLPAIPTIPTDPGDIVDILPTDPAELISDLPIPTLPSIPPIPTLPIPVPIPTGIPDLPLPTGTDLPKLPLPTPLPPDDPWPELPPGKDPDDIYKLPELTEIPYHVLGLLHGVISKLSTNPKLSKSFRDYLRLILRIINRLGGGDPVPNPGLPSPTIPWPTETKLPLPTLPIPTLPLPTLTTLLPTLPPRPTLTRPVRAVKARDAGSGKGPLSDKERKQLRGVVSDEVWASVDWSNPILAPITAAGAMVAFDAVFRVAESFKMTDDEGEKERLLSSFVVVDYEEVEA